MAMLCRSSRRRLVALVLCLLCLYLPDRFNKYDGSTSRLLVRAFGIFPHTTRTRRTCNKPCSSSPQRFPQLALSQKVSEQEQILSSGTTTAKRQGNNNDDFKGFGKPPLSRSSKSDNDVSSNDDETKDPSKKVDETLSLEQAKEELLDLLPRMMGQAHEFRRVEVLVNTLEDQYQPVQTLDFLNLLQQGEWQLLFSTSLNNKAQAASPQVFRMREMVQSVVCQQFLGNVTTTVRWDLADRMPGTFDCTGLFTVKASYEINQGARCLLNLNEHVLQPIGKNLPGDPQALVGLLYRAMPTQVFDPSDHAVDTTYLDGNLKILRYTGPKFEGVRDIWIRQGSLDGATDQQQQQTQMDVGDRDNHDSDVEDDMSIFMDDENDME